MKKDYIPVDSSLLESDDLMFVEHYWSKVWQSGQRRPAINGADEYRYLEAELTRAGTGIRILDAGCGRGEWTIALRSRGYDATGIDISGSVIRRLRSDFPAEGFVRGDIRQTDFPDGSFDLIFSWGAMEHCEDGLAESFSECHRLLSPKGKLLVSVPFQNIRHLLRDSRALKGWDEHYDPKKGYAAPMRFYQWRMTRGELHREFEFAGFTTKFVDPIHKSEGLSRALKHDIHIPPASALHRPIKAMLYPLVSAAAVGHMIVGLGIRR